MKQGLEALRHAASSQSLQGRSNVTIEAGGDAIICLLHPKDRAMRPVALWNQAAPSGAIGRLHAWTIIFASFHQMGEAQ
jgi:hypothetical protein